MNDRFRGSDADRDRGSGQSSSLARGYRRLLICYPGWYRQIHQQELLDVLMTDAPPDKRRPGIGEAADLILGALRIRCQPSRRGSEPAWRDALAVVSVIVPLAVALTSVAQLIRVMVADPALAFSGHWFVFSIAWALGFAALVPLALRMGRLAALGAAGVLVWAVCSASTSGVAVALNYTVAVPTVGLLIVALCASPGPRRALQIMTWKHWMFAVISIVVAGPNVIPMRLPVQLTLLAAVCTVMALTSSLGRWVLLLLAIPGYPIFAGPVPPGSDLVVAALGRGVAAQLISNYLPSLTVAGLAIATACRPVRRAG